MYTAMGAGALALTATQPWLAAPLGLVLSFVLGAGVGVGILLGSMPPAGGPGQPLLAA